MAFRRLVLLCCMATLVTEVSCEEHKEFERVPNDGWFNNLLHPDWGAIDTQLLRVSPASFSDGVYEPSGQDRPNPLEISEIAFNGTNNKGSERNRNAMMVFFGQQMVEEVLDAQRSGCPIEYFNIKVPRDHKYNPHKLDNLEMPFQRARYDQRTGYSPNNPRQQINEITPYIDGTLFYGAGKAVEDAIRSFKNGMLAANDTDIMKSYPISNKDIRLPYANPPSPRDHELKPVTRFRRYANPRTHENPFILTMATIWFRYHNAVAQKLQAEHEDWDDEQLFLSARKRVIGQYQKIVMYDWLPRWLGVYENGSIFDMDQYPYEGGRLNKYAGYDPHVIPNIATEFQAAAMRFGHTLVPSGIYPRKISRECTTPERYVKAKFSTKEGDNDDEDVKVKGIRLCNSFWVPQETTEDHPGSIDEMVRGLIYTKAAKEDNIIVSDIRENVFGTLDWSRRDLGSLNIQRGRDMGLPGYNAIREAYGLKRRERWEDINEEGLYSEQIGKLKELYGNTPAPDDLDLFPGGLLETTLDGPGELFRTIVLNQFLRIRHGDRFWYENKHNGVYTQKERDDIQRTTFFDVLKETTDFYDPNLMPENMNVFSCGGSPDVSTVFTDSNSTSDNSTTSAPTTGPSSGCACVDPDFESPEPEYSTGQLEKCVELKHYDYFTGSGAAYIVTIIAVILSLPGAIGLMLILVRLRHNSLSGKVTQSQNLPEPGPGEFYATEWVGRTTYGLLDSRTVKVSMDSTRHKLNVSNLKNQVVRIIDLRLRNSQDGGQERPKGHVTRSGDKGHKLMMLSKSGEIDLVLCFKDMQQRDAAFDSLKQFFESMQWTLHETHAMDESTMWREATTIDQRKKVLARFFKSVLSELSGKVERTSTAIDAAEQEALMTKLTRTEFADALGLQANSLFVRNMFLLVDSSGDGFVSFDEFKTYFGILCSGDADKKAEMFFQMFDTSRCGQMSKANYKQMIKSLLELNEETGTSKVDINAMVDKVFKELGKESLGYLTVEDFKTIMLSGDTEIWQAATLKLDVSGVAGATNRKSVHNRAKSFVANYNKNNARIKRVQSLIAVPEVELHSAPRSQPTGKLQIQLQKFTRYVDNHRRQIFWVTLYTIVLAAVFIERAYYYSVEREHGGLRRLAGFGVSITRGAASAQMFTYASLLVTMSRNTLTFFRETFLHRFIPFDNFHDMHIYIAFLAILFTIMHVIGHMINFYHISTQTPGDVTCYFREFYRPTHVLPTFQYWTYETITGLTGVLLVIVLVVMYVFAMPFSRRNLFNMFSLTHRLYIVTYILMFLHGSGRLVQPPLWGNFFIGPMVLFLFDKFISVRRNKILLPVVKAKLLPSGVINLVFKRPQTFDYQSGQWIRIACPDLGKSEYHPFTLTSAPHEEHLSLHIRAVGPWTDNIRKLFETKIGNKQDFPKIYMDGPFGESHQDWYRYPVAVLVGGGIGITPFASILKDIANRSKNLTRVPCQKVYFIWVTRTQRSFEWMTDIIREVETADTTGFVDVQICITQLKEKFDLRTTMLYICERHFQKVAGLSMFTGLRAKTHFGRPKFSDFFEALKIVHGNVPQIGVFSCGPGAMTRNVNTACVEHNAFTGPSLIHHFENF